MTGMNKELSADERENFMHSLLAFTKEHKAAHWAGTLDEFLDKVLPVDPQGIVRTSHQYLWDMIRWTRHDQCDGPLSTGLFADELFGICLLYTSDAADE